MRYAKHAVAFAAALTVGGLTFGRSAEADVIVNLNQVGSNVVATASGSIDLTGLTSTGVAGPSDPELAASGALLATGSPGSTPDVYTGFSGPTAFGSGGYLEASSGSGDYVGIVGESDLLAVPDGYVSGSSLSGSAIFDDETLASLGVTPGTYVWTWGGGPDGSFTINASISPVPEPSSLPTLLAGLAAIGGAFYLARKKAKRA